MKPIEIEELRYIETWKLEALKPHSRVPPQGGPADDGKRCHFSGSAGRFRKMSSAPMGEGVRGRGDSQIAAWDPADYGPRVRDILNKSHVGGPRARNMLKKSHVGGPRARDILKKKKKKIRKKKKKKKEEEEEEVEEVEEEEEEETEEE